MIYFIQAGDPNGAVKIGYSRTKDGVSRRLYALQTASFAPLKLLRVMNGSQRHERSLHRHFRELHIRGEWFKFDPIMITINHDVLSDIAPVVVCKSFAEFQNAGVLTALADFVSANGGVCEAAKKLGFRWKLEEVRQ